MLFGLFASPAMRANLVALIRQKRTLGSFLISHLFAALFALCAAMTTLCMESSVRHIESRIEDIDSQVVVLIVECDLM